MKICREHELVLPQPFHDGRRLWLYLLLVLGEVIGEVTIEIKAPGIVSETI